MNGQYQRMAHVSNDITYITIPILALILEANPRILGLKAILTTKKLRWEFMNGYYQYITFINIVLSMYHTSLYLI